jgi:hypothetical protein
MKIVIAGGGAPAYLYPGLAVAFQIRGAARNARIAFVGAGRDFDVWASDGQTVRTYDGRNHLAGGGPDGERDGRPAQEDRAESEADQ